MSHLLNDFITKSPIATISLDFYGINPYTH
jgi:hypothetical protein